MVSQIQVAQQDSPRHWSATTAWPTRIGCSCWVFMEGCSSSSTFPSDFPITSKMSLTNASLHRVGTILLCIVACNRASEERGPCLIRAQAHALLSHLNRLSLLSMWLSPTLSDSTGFALGLHCCGTHLKPLHSLIVKDLCGRYSDGRPRPHRTRTRSRMWNWQSQS